MAHDDAAGGQHLLDHAQAEREAEVEPDRVADDLGRKAVAGVRQLGGWRHAGSVAASPPAGNLTRPNLTVPINLTGDYLWPTNPKLEPDGFRALRTRTAMPVAA